MRSIGLGMLLGGAWLLAAAAPPPVSVMIGRYGQVSAQEAGPTVPPRGGNVVGSTPVDAPSFIRLGADVEGAYCRQFGFEFRARNLPPMASIPVEIQLDHPAWHLPDGRISTREVNENSISSDRWSYSGYTLEESFSLVPGPWTFSVVAAGRVLATVSFNVTVQPGQILPPGGCDAPTS